MFWQKSLQVTQQAIEDNELHPIATEAETILQDDIHFQVHIINQNLLKKIDDKRKRGNPFLPYQKPMYVAEAGESHVCLLNKYPVINQHLLICTKDYQEQTAPLTIEDFNAWYMGMEDGIWGFYNGGVEAGASQPHRHMQLVKAPLPMAAKLKSGQLGFKHRALTFENFDAKATYEFYIDALNELDLYDPFRCLPNNVLLTQDSLVVIPRVTNNQHGVFLNGLNYGGIFLFRDRDKLDWAKNYQLSRLMSDCALSLAGNQ
ncbi:phosphorylase [Aliikangiella marina]|uniref:Phosphorylase n=1 Tax=Aliikangiella marina TaxID=1712262 RepID=A0A545T2Q6_9GAMM|nr:DUF4922 domain-containing protein [Aliikangiella marina]TQV71492.1 phosphorylase [Aliikangiella marina]